MTTPTLTPELRYAMDAYWRAANYLSVGQIYLYDNPLLKRPLALADIKYHAARALGHHARDRISSTFTSTAPSRNTNST